MAVPLDTVPGGGDATKLNTIIVYSMINGGFESIDTVNSTEFAIRELIVGKEGSQNALYLTTEEGGIHKVDGADGGDVVSMSAGQAVPETIACSKRNAPPGNTMPILPTGKCFPVPSYI